MKRSALALAGSIFVLSVTLIASATTVEAQPGAQAASTSAAGLCNGGGFADYTRDDGTEFRNTGDCVSYVRQGGTLKPVGADPEPTPPPSGVILSVEGELSDESDTFRRPPDWASPDSCVTAPGAWAYEAHPLTLNADATARISMRGHDSGGGTLDDPFIALYTADFDPEEPCAHVLAADDDSGVGLDAELEIELAAGSYVIVTTSRSPVQTGTYSLEVLLP